MNSSLSDSLEGAIELRPTLSPRPGISHVVFDFDGTLSWLRHGWPVIMLGLCREHLAPAEGETPEEFDAFLLRMIFEYNGRPTIMQLIRFAEIVLERTGRSLDPEMLRQEFQHRLDAEITSRCTSIQQGSATREAFIVYRALPLIERLKSCGLKLMILSSTVQERVREEAELLGLTPYFTPHIYGGTGDPMKFTKRGVFERILAEEGITGANLLSFGDGPVELAETKALGGVAIAVCSDEDENGSGKMEPIKLKQLLDAGADAAIPDYRDALVLVDYLLGR